MKIDASWDLGVCAKCAGLLVVPLSVTVEARGCIDPRGYLLWGERICPPCDWYEIEFDDQLCAWEDAQEDPEQDDYASELSDSLWFGNKLGRLRDEYAQHVAELIVLKREQARRALREAAPLILPRQVPWSWLENTDYGRFRMDDHPRAV